MSDRSPFPGMDPYLESSWRDVHVRLATSTCNALQKQLAGDLRARIDERLIIEHESDATRDVYPDVKVVERKFSPVEMQGAATITASKPLIVPLPTEPRPERFVKIIDRRSGGRVVTIIEYLSPSNKRMGASRNSYRQKQQECIDGDINLVEIDLTRSGRRELAYPPLEVPQEYLATYIVSVFRGWGSRQFEIYRIPLRERLPVISIPLRDIDTDIVLDLQPLLDQAYIDGRYDDTDYSTPCEPPLDPVDEKWADELLRAAGKRRGT